MNRSLLSLLLVVAAAGVCAWLAPGVMVQPGRLLPDHQDLRNQCLACHEAGRGVTRAKCVLCHKPEGIGLATAAGRALEVPRPAVQGLHQRGRELECSLCHAEHAGRLDGGAAARFTHERLPSGLAQDCLACHDGQQPADGLHQAARMACGDCHGLEAWQPARFDHGLLDDSAATCLTCHLQDRPRDELHGKLEPSADCRPCHRSRAWTPADYDHERFFRFDGNHPAHCADCHAPGSGYRSYSCTGCHAHSAARLASEHREEGIRDWRDCVRCHRSGDEEEGRGGEGGTGEGEGSEHEGHGEDDD